MRDVPWWKIEMKISPQSAQLRLFKLIMHNFSFSIHEHQDTFWIWATYQYQNNKFRSSIRFSLLYCGQNVVKVDGRAIEQAVALTTSEKSGNMRQSVSLSCNQDQYQNGLSSCRMSGSGQTFKTSRGYQLRYVLCMQCVYSVLCACKTWSWSDQEVFDGACSNVIHEIQNVNVTFQVGQNKDDGICWK